MPDQPENPEIDKELGAEALTAAGASEFPDGPRSLLGTIWNVITRVFSRLGNHRTTDWAAALTYYSILSIFPGLIVLVSLLGLVGGSATDTVIHNLENYAPGPVRDTLVSAFSNIRNDGATAGVLLSVSLLASLYSSSSYVGAFIRASNSVWEVKEERRFYKTIPLRIGIVALLLILVFVIGLAIVFTGPLAHQLRQLSGLGDGSVLLWDLAKWPILIVLVAFGLAILYRLGPNVDHDHFRVITIGSVFAGIVWLLASVGFTIYVAGFAKYNKTYGSLAGIVIFLVWLWITNLAVLLGVEVDAEIQRYRREHGHSPFQLRNR